MIADMIKFVSTIIWHTKRFFKYAYIKLATITDNIAMDER
jgi:hypothetical protein